MNSCISPAAYEANNEANNIEIALDSCPQVMYNKTTDCFLQTSGCASAQRRGFLLKPVIPILAGSFHLCTLTFSYDLYSVLPQFVRWRIAGRNAYDR